jgi:outer membrane receptor for ferrienterochelin and colicin
MKKRITFVLITLAIATISYSQDIETLWDIDITTASKSAEKMSDAPGIVSIITHDEIINFGSVSLADVLNRVTSVYMIHAGTYMWNIASIRGQNISVFDNHVLILINGRPLRDGISGGHNNVFYNSFPVEGIERIEIIRGPGSVLYGTNAYAGVINIITAKAENGTHFQATMNYGSFNTKSVNFGGGLQVNDNVNVNFGGRWYDDDGSTFGGVFDGEIEKPENHSTYKKERWTRDNNSLFLNLNYHKFSILAGYGEIFPFALVPPIKWEWKDQKAGDEISHMKHYFTDLGYSSDLSENYSISANITYNGHLWQGMVDLLPDQQKALSNNIMGELTLQGTPAENLHFTLGGLYDVNKFEGVLFNSNGTHTKINTYLQFDYTLFDKLKLIGGAQLNKIQNVKVNISPRIGLIFHFSDKLGVKALYSSAFRSPYPQETNVYHPLYSGNPNLSPELINTMEAQVFFQNEKIQTSLTVYKSHMYDLINKIKGSDSVGVYNGHATYATFYNDGEFDFLGLEFEGKFALTQKLSLFTNFTYQENESGNGIKNAAIWPNTMAKAGIMYAGEKISGGIYDSYFGEPTQVNYIRDQREKEKIEELNPKASAYNLLTANICFDLFRIFNLDYKTSLKLGFYADNLLDEKIWFPEFARYEVNTLPLHNERSFYGKLSFRF